MPRRRREKNWVVFTRLHILFNFKTKISQPKLLEIKTILQCLK